MPGDPKLKELVLPGTGAQTEEDARLEEMAEALQALANANRLRLLRWLTVPTAAGDIPLSPAEVKPGENPDRVMTRQGVRGHLLKLAEQGLLEIRREERPTGPVDAFVINHQRLFALFEALRSVTTVAPKVRVDSLTTMAAPQAAAPRKVTGPRLSIVKGRDEGSVVALVRAKEQGDRGWIVGRKPECQVALDYDPFVSSEHAEIVPKGGGNFALLDLRSSKNGTFLNFERLPRGGEAPLKHGDVVGVGATLLVFQAD